MGNRTTRLSESCQPLPLVSLSTPFLHRTVTIRVYTRKSELVCITKVLLLFISHFRAHEDPVGRAGRGQAGRHVDPLPISSSRILNLIVKQIGTRPTVPIGATPMQAMSPREQTRD